jgi:glucose-1-phosphate adenylyltransferase
VLSGDHVYKMDYAKMLAEHVQRDADLSVACIEVPVGEASDFGVMAVDAESRVTGFDEKPAKPTPLPGRADRALISMGVYVFEANFLYEQLIRDAADPGSNHDFGKDIIPHLVRSGYSVYAHNFASSCVNVANGVPYWRDVGTIDAYWEANMELVKVQPELDLYDAQWPIWTHQEQLPPAKFVFDEDNRRGLAADSMVSGGCVVSGATVRRSLLFSKVRVNEHALVEDSVVLPSVDIARGAVVRRAILDRGCRLPEGIRIGIDSEHDRQRFHVSPGGVVIVTPEMLGQQLHYVP